MTTYGYYAPVTIEVDLSGANGGNALSNMTALIKVNNDQVIWAMYPGGTFNNGLNSATTPFSLTTVLDPNAVPTSSLPIAQFYIDNEIGGDKELSMTYIPNNSSQGGVDKFWIYAYAWGVYSSGDVNFQLTIDSGITVYINQTPFYKSGKLPVTMNWLAFPSQSSSSSSSNSESGIGY